MTGRKRPTATPAEAPEVTPVEVIDEEAVAEVTEVVTEEAVEVAPEGPAEEVPADDSPLATERDAVWAAYDAMVAAATERFGGRERAEQRFGLKFLNRDDFND